MLLSLTIWTPLLGALLLAALPREPIRGVRRTAFVLSLVPLPIAGYRMVAPAVVLISVYHWTVYRPDLLPPIVVFSIGIAQDLLTGGPFGTGPLTLLLVHLVVSSQRRFLLGKAFPIVWWGFGLIAADHRWEGAVTQPSAPSAPPAAAATGASR